MSETQNKVETKFTPGPWVVRDSDCPDVITGNGEHAICTTNGVYATKEQKLANARLIAAAPELYAACQRCIMALAANGAPNCEAVKEARAALAKASTTPSGGSDE